MVYRLQSSSYYTQTPMRSPRSNSIRLARVKVSCHPHRTHPSIDHPLNALVEPPRFWHLPAAAATRNFSYIYLVRFMFRKWNGALFFTSVHSPLPWWHCSRAVSLWLLKKGNLLLFTCLLLLYFMLLLYAFVYVPCAPRPSKVSLHGSTILQAALFEHRFRNN